MYISSLPLAKLSLSVDARHSSFRMEPEESITMLFQFILLNVITDILF